MSVANTIYRCTDCTFEATAVASPITLIYQLPKGEEMVTGREFGWCSTCNGIRNVEPDFSRYFDSEERIAELKRGVNSPITKVVGLLKKCGGDKRPTAELQELQELSLGLKIARARNSSPRCLTCGASGVIDISEYVHTCGGRLVRMEFNNEAPRFSYRPQVFHLDYEGHVVGKFGGTDGYENLATHVSIAGVFEKGLFSGVLVEALFDKEDLAPIAEDIALFKAFIKVIETRLALGDFENPFAGFTEGPTEAQMASLMKVPRVLLTRKKELVSKWTRS